MPRVIYMRVCPRCGERATILTIKHENGHIAKAVFCSSDKCNVNTGWTYGEMQDVLRRWDDGIGLEYRDGEPFCRYDRKRPFLAAVVEI